MDNIEKSMTMTYHLGATHTRISDEDFRQRIIGEVATYQERLL